MKKILYIALSLFVSTVSFSQKRTATINEFPEMVNQISTDSLHSKELNDVIVTGQYRPQTLKQSVFQVRTISADQIRRQGATGLTDILNKQMNFRFSQDLATGGSSITLLGLKGQNVKILLDGLPIAGRQGTTNEIDINQIDINSIERIEIVEGPMSVVYGADALAGMINIITKKTIRSSINVIARVHEETVGEEYGISEGIHNQYIGLTSRIKNWELGGSFGRNYFGGWKDTATGRELEWHKKDQLLANGFIGWANGKFRIKYRIDGLDEIITNPGNFLFYEQTSGDTLAEDQEYLTDRIMNQLQAGFKPNGKWDFQLQSAFTHYSRQVFSTTVSKENGDVRLDLGTGRQSAVQFNSFTGRASAVYKLNKVFSFQPGAEIQLDEGEGERLKAGRNKVNDFAFFITSEITPNSKWSIRPGLRFISNSVYKAPPVVPSLNIKYAVSKSLDLRLAYARGFRSPSLRELYFNFFDANHEIVGNPDLKAETSQSFTGSLNWEKEKGSKSAYTAQLAGFYNTIKNGIDYAVSASNPNEFVLTNLTDAKTAGINASVSVQSNRWNISGAAGYTGFYNDYSTTDKSTPVLEWSPEAATTISYSIPAAAVDLNLFCKFTGRRPFYSLNSNQQLQRAEQEGYSLADFTITKKAFKNFSFNAGIKNLFDADMIKSTGTVTGIHTSNGTTSIGTGRSYFIEIAFNWKNGR